MFVDDPIKRDSLLFQIKKILNPVDDDESDGESSPELDAVRLLNEENCENNESEKEDGPDGDLQLGSESSDSDDDEDDRYLYDRFGNERASPHRHAETSAANPVIEQTKKRRNRLAMIQKFQQKANSTNPNDRFFNFDRFRKELAKAPLSVRPKGKKKKEFYNRLKDTMMNQKSQLTTGEYLAASVIAACQYPWLWEREFSGVVSSF